MSLASASRVGHILRGIAWPADDSQADDLLVALGGTDAEVRRGSRLFERARKERDTTAARSADPDWWRRSGYVDLVADIAPVELHDRSGELDELAAWCTSDEAYVWWQAPPRAGKSALMSWFVLHPPPDVWVVSFFVTARLASQADSAAYTDSLLDQLGAITGEAPPPLSSVAERDRLRRRLLGDALTKAAEEGRQLVLVVDGLDEDCGSLPGSAQASIAALLPKRPNGLKVIVAGRPDPPVSADVDPDHPLRAARTRVLAPSSFARHITELAERELDEVLAGRSDQHQGLNFEVLGLVTAGGGGLDRDDLQMLTGRPAYQIDQLVHGLFGRTIAARTQARGNRRVFAFTHETLRIQAADRLGPHTLGQFRERRRVWANRNPQQTWPDDTPAYLVLHYFDTLKDRNDLPGMLTLATDTARHQRLRNVTGGDDTALIEIGAAQQALHQAGVEYLPDIARLALLRERIRRRNQHIPWSLVEARARLGQIARAEALARSLPEADDRARVFTTLAGIAAERGQLEEAERLAMAVPAGHWHVSALLDVARAAMAAGEMRWARRLVDSVVGLVNADPGLQQVRFYGRLAVAAARLGDRAESTRFADRAEAVAEAKKFPGMRQQELALAGRAAFEAGDTDRAIRLLDALYGPATRIPQLRELALAAARNGDLERAAEWLGQAADLCQEFDNTQERANRCALVATAFAELGHAERAMEMAERAVADARQLEPAASINTLSWCMDAAITAGRPEYATELLHEAVQAGQTVAGPRERSLMLAPIAWLLAAIDPAWLNQLLKEIDEPEACDKLLEAVLRRPFSASPKRIQELAGMIQDPFQRAQTLAGIAGEFAARGALDDASGCADQAEQIAQSIETAEARTASVVATVNAMLQIGDLSRAVELAGHLESNVALVDMFGQGPQLRIAAIEALAAAGDWAAAMRLAHSPNPSGISVASPAVALAVFRAGFADRAREMVLSLPTSVDKVQALAQLADAHLAANQQEPAGELVVLAQIIADAITEQADRDYALLSIAPLLCRLGDIEEARRAAGMIQLLGVKAAALVRIAVTAATIMQIKMAEQVIFEAEAMIRELGAGYPQVDALCDLAAAAAAANLSGLTDRLLSQAAATARLEPMVDDQLATVVAAAAAKVARLDTAEALLRDSGAILEISTSSVASNIAESLRFMLEQNDFDRVNRILGDIRGDWRPHIQKRCAIVAATTGNFTAAENLSQAIEEPDLQTTAFAALATAAPAGKQQLLLSRALIIGGWDDDACLTAMAQIAPNLAKASADELISSLSGISSEYVVRTMKPRLTI